MKTPMIDKLEKMRDEIRDLISSRLSYPKSILSLLREGSPRASEIDKSIRYIDESIHLATSKITELMIEEEGDGKSRVRKNAKEKTIDCG